MDAYLPPLLLVAALVLLVRPITALVSLLGTKPTFSGCRV